MEKVKMLNVKSGLARNREPLFVGIGHRHRC